MPRTTYSIDENKCTHCHNCIRLAEEIFSYKEPPKKVDESIVFKAMRECPIRAINIVRVKKE